MLPICGLSTDPIPSSFPPSYWMPPYYRMSYEMAAILNQKCARENLQCAFSLQTLQCAMFLFSYNLA